VVAFAFAQAPGLDENVDRVIPSSVSDLGAVLGELQAERVSAVVFCGKFRTGDLLGVSRDALGDAIVTRGGGGLSEAELARGAVAVLDAVGIDVLDQRPFFRDWMSVRGPLGGRHPTEAERSDVERGVRVARQLAGAGVGQTVVVRQGVVTAVEASEGTTEAIRRGLALGGPGAVVVKAVAPDNDYRFDVPSVGLETLEVMAAGHAAVLAIEAGRVLVLDRERVAEVAARGGIAVVGVELPAPGEAR
jgi:DUF1009 family protein